MTLDSHTASARMPSAPPQYSVKKSRHGSTIEIGDWTITATKRPILNGKEIEASVYGPVCPSSLKLSFLHFLVMLLLRRYVRNLS